MKKLRILLADDHKIFLEGLSTVIEKIEGVQVVGEARNGKVLLQLARKLKPDVVITDISMPEMDGIEATRILRSEFPQMGILALSMHTENELIMEMMDAGANGYLAKNADRLELADAIDAAHMLRQYFCKTTGRSLMNMLAQSKTFSKRALEQMSEKEIAIIRMICEEKTSKEIGTALNLSVRTIESYRVQIQEKINVRGTVGIVVFGMHSGIFKPPY
jgi:DNA-binding NarL/FixJ family response regulator